MSDPFYLAYVELSKQGKCDSPLGIEYQRVREEWTAIGSPLVGLHEFIAARTNWIPGGGGERFN